MCIVDMFRAAATLANKDTAGAVEHYDADATSIGERVEGLHHYVLLFGQSAPSSRVTAACKDDLWPPSGDPAEGRLRSSDVLVRQLDRLSSIGSWRRPR
jgi:hypothetical protein